MERDEKGLGESNPAIAANEVETPVSSEYQRRTPLGRGLWELRLEGLAAGEELLDWAGLEREVAERRGGTKADSRSRGASL